MRPNKIECETYRCYCYRFLRMKESAIFPFERKIVWPSHRLWYLGQADSLLSNGEREKETVCVCACVCVCSECVQIFKSNTLTKLRCFSTKNVFHWLYQEDNSNQIHQISPKSKTLNKVSLILMPPLFFTNIYMSSLFFVSLLFFLF